MTQDGFSHVVSVDFSEVVIEKMTKRFPGQTYLKMDIREMSFASGSFDVVLDKAVLDTLQADSGDKWCVAGQTL